ncbi:hypothetical protein [Desulfosporosinus nitroreducens]|uniref:Uncharacterized protein n=1 Tax=Desulfosporosinus nitroreducens TaxID=2018668 RepID=A0ABT8QVL5_9FIRM|nr:hypothetical protein [Desulfosporosinus nitroreducens]MDO0825386.1 hypothetical protein [Desulfosporosinus nitroreducens]
MAKLDYSDLLRQTKKVVSLFIASNNKSQDPLLIKLIERYNKAIDIMESNRIMEKSNVKDLFKSLLCIEDEDIIKIKTNYSSFVKQIKLIDMLLELIFHPRRFSVASLYVMKEYEDELKSVFRFGPDEEADGKLELDKKAGTISLMEAISDCDLTDRYFEKVALSLLKKWVSKEELLDRMIIDTGW